MTFQITVNSGVPEGELEPGTYPAACDGVEQKTINVKGEDREVYIWKYLVATENDDGSAGEPVAVEGLTSTMSGPMSKTFKTLVALLGAEAVQAGVSFELGDLKGKQCLVVVAHNDSGYAKVTEVMSLPKSMRKQTIRSVAQPVTVPATDEDDGEKLPF